MWPGDLWPGFLSLRRTSWWDLCLGGSLGPWFGRGLVVVELSQLGGPEMVPLVPLVLAWEGLLGSLGGRLVEVWLVGQV